MSSAMLEALNEQHPDSLTDGDWEELLAAIEAKKCTPVIGAGACAGTLPLGREVAARWAKKYNYPFQDFENLPRVAQFLMVQGGPMVVAKELKAIFTGSKLPNFDDENEPHRILSDLDLPLYVTTNYDDFMFRALARRLPQEQIRRVACSWYLIGQRQGDKRLWKPNTKEPSPTNVRPLVFHLHGDMRDTDSVVLTEDDYLDFLVALTNEPDLLPASIADAFASSSLLFMGYSLEDINFKVMWRKVRGFLERNKRYRHISVQIGPLPNETTAEMLARAEAQRKYIQEQLANQKVRIFWGTCEHFAKRLRERLEAAKLAPAAA